jgi:hypothetical protein
MNRLKFYRRMRGGVWVKYYDKREATRTYWVRYKTVEEAYTLGKWFHEPICFEYYGEFPWGDLQNTVYMVKEVTEKFGVGSLSDGYHTFNELYAHRNRLFVSLLNIFHKSKMYTVWKSKKSQEGHAQGDWFIAGIDTKDKQGYITYHLPMSMWDVVQAPEIERARWDGHTSPIVLFRLIGIEQIGSYRIEHVDNVKP